MVEVKATAAVMEMVTTSTIRLGRKRCPRIPERDLNAEHRREYGGQYKIISDPVLCHRPFNGDTLAYSLDGTDEGLVKYGQDGRAN